MMVKKPKPGEALSNVIPTQPLIQEAAQKAFPKMPSKDTSAGTPFEGLNQGGFQPSAVSPQKTPGLGNVTVSKDAYGNISSYAVNSIGGKTILTPEQWHQLTEAQRSGRAPSDRGLAQLYNEEILQNTARRLESSDFRMRQVQQELEKQKIAQIQQQEFPTPLPPTYQGQPVPTQLPETQPTSTGGFGNILGEALKSGAKGAATAAPTVAAGALGLSATGIGAPIAVPAAAVTEGLAFVGSAIYGGFSAIKESKKAVLTEAASLGRNAEQGLLATIRNVKSGYPIESAITDWRQDLTYLSQAMSNLKQLQARDRSYFEKKGLTEMADLQRAIDLIPFYAQKLQEASLMQSQNDMSLLNNIPMQPQPEVTE